MFIDGTDPNNPVYLVTPSGQYVCGTDGNPRVFSGEAIEGHESGYLVDRYGNFLLQNNVYIPSPSVGAEGEKKEKNRTLILLAILLVIALVAGGGVLAYYLVSKDSEASPSPSATSTQNTATPEPGDIETAEPSESPQATPSPQAIPSSGIQLPPEAYPGAGSASVPSNAIYYQEFAVQSPSENILCFDGNDRLFCGVRSWIQSKPYGISDNCVDSSNCWPYNTVFITERGQAELIATDNANPGPILPYGSVAYGGNWVCASEENGMTCWSRASGHGFFLNRDGYKAF